MHRSKTKQKIYIYSLLSHLSLISTFWSVLVLISFSSSPLLKEDVWQKAINVSACSAKRIWMKSAWKQLILGNNLNNITNKKKKHEEDLLRNVYSKGAESFIMKLIIYIRFTCLVFFSFQKSTIEWSLAIAEHATCLKILFFISNFVYWYVVLY